MAEKGLNELPRELRVLFTKGTEALQRDNFDYAIDLFNQVLAKAPAEVSRRRRVGDARGAQDIEIRFVLPSQFQILQAAPVASRYVAVANP